MNVEMKHQNDYIPWSVQTWFPLEDNASQCIYVQTEFELCPNKDSLLTWKPEQKNKIILDDTFF